MNAAAFKRCLPALQQIARFPNCNRAYVCRKRMMDLNEVESVIRDGLGELELRIWNEEALAGAAKIHGIKVPEYRPDMTSPPAPPEPIDTPPPVAVRAVGARAVLPRGSVVEKVLRAGKSLPPEEPAQPPVQTEKSIYLKVCTELFAHPEYSDSEACRQAGVHQSNWAYFKKKNFKSGRTIEPEALRAILERMGGEVREPKAMPKSPGSADSATNGVASPAKSKIRKSKLTAQYLRMCELLRNEEGLSEAAGCLKLELNRKSWCQFKYKHLGTGYIGRDKLRNMILLLGGSVTEATKASVPMDVAPVPADGKAPKFAGPAFEGAISVKERQHLVASLACGILANTNYRPAPASVIGQAYQLYNELLEQDLAWKPVLRKEGA